MNPPNSLAEGLSHLQSEDSLRDFKKTIEKANGMRDKVSQLNVAKGEELKGSRIQLREIDRAVTDKIDLYEKLIKEKKDAEKTQIEGAKKSMEDLRTEVRKARNELGEGTLFTETAAEHWVNDKTIKMTEMWQENKFIRYSGIGAVGVLSVFALNGLLTGWRGKKSQKKEKKEKEEAPAKKGWFSFKNLAIFGALGGGGLFVANQMGAFGGNEEYKAGGGNTPPENLRKQAETLKGTEKKIVTLKPGETLGASSAITITPVSVGGVDWRIEAKPTTPAGTVEVPIMQGGKKVGILEVSIAPEKSDKTPKEITVKPGSTTKIDTEGRIGVVGGKLMTYGDDTDMDNGFRGVYKDGAVHVTAPGGAASMEFILRSRSDSSEKKIRVVSR